MFLITQACIQLVSFLYYCSQKNNMFIHGENVTKKIYRIFGGKSNFTLFIKKKKMISFFLDTVSSVLETQKVLF